MSRLSQVHNFLIILKSINDTFKVKMEELAQIVTEEPADYIVDFSGNSTSYCVGLIDMVDSTKISTRLSIGQISKYYQIFLNTMSKTLSKYGGQVIKNVGDSLLFYFPESSKNRTFGFMSCIEGSLGMIDMHDVMCIEAKKEGLPCINYRISCDYGPVAMMKPTGVSVDMIGPPVNMCAKINHSALNNDVIIGGDLYQMVKKISDYKFSFAGDYNSSLKNSYPLYNVARV